MPFTPSHAVVALPFVRIASGFAAALAMGAMTPDVPLFVHGTPLSYAVTHGWPWIPLTACVAGLLLALWCLVIRPGIRELSPRWLAERLPEEWDGYPRAREAGRRVPLMILGLLVGVASHIAWDAFTHADGAGTAPLGLDAPWGALPGYQWLQYGSSVLGLGILFLAGLAWARRRPMRPVQRMLPGAVRIVWWVSFPAALLLVWVIGLLVLGPFREGFGPQHLAFHVLLPTAAVWAVPSAVLCGVIGMRRALAR